MELNDKRVLDIGAGAGNISSEYNKNGYSVIGTEHTDTGIDLIIKHNPHIDTVLLNIANIDHDTFLHKFDLIVCRELYPFTRVNCFDEQLNALKDICKLLDSNGVLLLIGSSTSYPHCSDYQLLMKAIVSDSAVKFHGSYAELLVKRKWTALGKALIGLSSYFINKLQPLLKRVFGSNFAVINMYVIEKR